MIGKMANFNSGKWAVQKVINVLKSKNKVVKQYVPDGVEISEDEIYDGPDWIYFSDGKKYSCPDVEVYRNRDFSKLLIRVEVKSFSDFPKLENEEDDLVCIKQYSIQQYLALQKREEIPIRIIFVIGTRTNVRYYFWETLNNMIENLPMKKIRYKGRFDEYPSLHYFWRVKDLRDDFV